MIGRANEMALLEEMVQSRKFEFLVMYGRRRVGKTTILQSFSERHPCIFYAAQEKNDALNVSDFSGMVQRFFSGSAIASFGTWERAFDFIDEKMQESDQKTVLIIDEFPFIAKENPSVKSILQHRIDHIWKERNMFLILCGSSVSFMLNDVMGYESPLYGRATSKLEVLPFDYREAADFVPAYSPEEKALSYGILGGIPRYLMEFGDDRSVAENIAVRITRSSSFLNDEPAALLRMELRETNIYSSILETIAHGVNKVHEIADQIHEEPAKVSKYLSVLTTLRLVEKAVPCGASDRGKKVIYEITDNYFRFWYRYIFSNRSYYELIGEKEAAEDIMKNISDFMGPVFEQMCLQYMRKLAKKRQLSFVPFYMGKWWGNNPAIRAQDDVDILCLNKEKDKAIFCECKYRNRPMPMEEYDDLVNAVRAFPNVRQYSLFFFSKGGYTAPVEERAKREGAVLLTLDDLYS